MRAGMRFLLALGIFFCSMDNLAQDANRPVEAVDRSAHAEAGANQPQCSVFTDTAATAKVLAQDARKMFIPATWQASAAGSGPTTAIDSWKRSSFGMFHQPERRDDETEKATVIKSPAKLLDATVLEWGRNEAAQPYLGWGVPADFGAPAFRPLISPSLFSPWRTGDRSSLSKQDLFSNQNHRRFRTSAAKKTPSQFVSQPLAADPILQRTSTDSP
jgi:hypothetical protein